MKLAFIIFLVSAMNLAWGEGVNSEATLRGYTPITNNLFDFNGSELYSGNCASCHAANGTGSQDHYFPSLIGNNMAPEKLIKIILDGVQHTGARQEIFMPGFADKLNDAEVALLSNFIVQEFGKGAPTITEKQVQQLRNNEEDGIWSSLMTSIKQFWKRYF